MRTSFIFAFVFLLSLQVVIHALPLTKPNGIGNTEVTDAVRVRNYYDEALNYPRSPAKDNYAPLPKLPLSQRRGKPVPKIRLPPSNLPLTNEEKRKVLPKLSIPVDDGDRSHIIEPFTLMQPTNPSVKKDGRRVGKAVQPAKKG